MPAGTQAIIQAAPRTTVQVTLPDGRVLEGPIKTPILDFLQAARQQGLIADHTPLIAAICDGRLRELKYPLLRDAAVAPVYLSSSDGGRIYRRSLVLLMTAAVDELWPGTHISVNYAVPDGGFFCEPVNRAPFNEEEVARLEAHMRRIVAEDSPIEKYTLPLAEAVELFKSRGDDDKVRLLDYRTRDTLTIYRLRKRADYYYGYMVPSTGYLQTFRLIPVKKGLILQYPRKEHPTELKPITTYHKLSRVFEQADEWLQRMEVEDIGRLNHLVNNGRIQELILVAEALHEQHIAQIATQIREQHRSTGARVILIAGPSSSGKTTFAKRLAIQLLAHGLRPFTLEMDNYFVDRELTPRDENGEYDFESIHALNLPLFNEHLVQLLDGKEVRLPRFDFKSGRSVPGQGARLHQNQIIILEGIHGLNPALVPDIPPEAVFRVYVSALTQLNTDLHNRVPTTDVRLLRRIVRDASKRGWSATDTLGRWSSVRRGEKTNIFPYQENADVMFNSALVYELAALRSLVEPLLLQVEIGTPPHIEANRLLSFLRWVQPLSEQERAMIPDTSLLREFIGGSILEQYHPSEPLVGQ